MEAVSLNAAWPKPKTMVSTGIPITPSPTGPPQGDPVGQAVASLRGYAYQIYVSAVAWLKLTDDEELYLEVAQDYAVAVHDALAAVQVKDVEATVTIVSEGARQAIDDFVDLVTRNPGRRVTLHFLSTAGIGRERAAEHRVGSEPTLHYWTKVASVAEVAPLREILNKVSLSNAARAFIAARSDEELLNHLIRRISWDCGSPPLDQIRRELEDQLVLYGAGQLKIPADEARQKSAPIIQHLLAKAVSPEASKRKLTSADLLSLLDTASRVSLPRADVDIIVKTAADFARGAAVPHGALLPLSESPQLAIAREALERDFASRYRRAQQRSFFPENLSTDQFQPLAREILDGQLTVLSQELRRRILLHAARSASLRNERTHAVRFFEAATPLRGPESDLPARARMAEAQGDLNGAIQILRDAADADSLSVLFTVLVRAKGDDSALAWLVEQNLSVRRLTSNGVLALCQIHLRKEDYAAVKAVLDQATDDQIDESPHLLMLRGAARFPSLLSKPDQKLPLMGLQLDVRRVRPIFPDAQVAQELDLAISDFQRLIPLARELELRAAVRVAEDYLVWFDLVHPGRRSVALTRLRADMLEPAKALGRIQYAFAYDPIFDPAPISQYLERREAMGGLNDDEVRAGLLIAMHSEKTAPVAAFIAKYRTQLDASFGKSVIRLIEIQALARSGDAAGARAVLDANPDQYDDAEVARLNAQIAAAEGADPVAEYKRAYESAKTAESLRALIATLAQRDDYRAIAPYAEQLFALTDDPRDVAYAATAYAKVGDNENFMRLVEAQPGIMDADSNLARHYGWQLLRRGRMKEATQQVDRLRVHQTTRDLDLEIALAIDTGDWEALAVPLAACLQSAANLPAFTLMRAAHLAQVSGHGPLIDLIAAAIGKGGNDPNVLLGAYTLYIEEGLEEVKNEAQGWFRRALDLSGPEGPIRQFELKDILAKQVEWNEHTREIHEAISRGDMPLAVAAAGLHTTIVDVLLRNLARNASLADARRRVSLPLFSGRRMPGRIGEIRRIALDLSALLVLGWLGLLPKVLDAFPEVVIPAGTFRDLFEGRQRIRQLQKSKLQRAENLARAIARRRIKIVRSSLAHNDPLVAEVGDELAGLIRAAQASGGFVLRPAPVHKPGLDMADADVSPYADQLADMHALLTALSNSGAIDQNAETTARQYFRVQDKGWPASPTLETTRPLYLDGLGLVYLESVQLLENVLNAFPDVYIDASTEDEATALIEYDRQVSEVLRVIDAIRDCIRKAHSANKIIFGPRRAAAKDDEDGFESSTVNLVSDLMQSDVATFDDRSINKEPVVDDGNRHRARIVTTLDVIEELHGRMLVSDDDRRSFRHRLRVAGAALVPVDKEEIVAAALRTTDAYSAELRGIQDSILLAQVAEIPRFPAEIPWFGAVMNALKNATTEVWLREPDHQRAASHADAILGLKISPEDWIARWDGPPPPNWVEAVKLVGIVGLAVPVELDSAELVQAYNAWLEKGILAPLRARSPSAYAQVVQQIRAFVNTVSERDDD
jgi:hypothetical protein